MLLYLLVLVFIVNFVSGTKPNVLFLIVDDLRPALGVYGDSNAFTPNIDRLASGSFVFKNAFSQALCAPSRNSLLTSRRPDSLHLYDFDSYWRETVGNFTTLPQAFKEAGYLTQSFGKVFHPGISSNWSDDASYSWSGVPFHPQSEKYENEGFCRQNKRNLLCPVVVEDQPMRTLPDIEIKNATIAFIRQKQSKPYFLAVGFHKPHIPFKFPAEFLKFHQLDKVVLPSNRWQPSDLPTVAWNPWMDCKKRDDVAKLNISFPFGRMTDRFMARVIQHYNAATSYTDSLIGEIINEIDRNNTIVVLTSDHGWSRGEHGEFAKYSNFEVATRVPLLISLPNQSAFKQVDQLVELVDLFPTLVDLAQISPFKVPTCTVGTNVKLCTEGRSFFKGEKSAVFSQYPRPSAFPSRSSDEPKLHEIKIMGYTVRTQRHRYTEWVEFNHSTFSPNWANRFGVELYDHLIDPGENLNLADRAQMVNVVKKLKITLIKGWRQVGN